MALNNRVQQNVCFAQRGITHPALLEKTICVKWSTPLRHERNLHDENNIKMSIFLPVSKNINDKELFCDFHGWIIAVGMWSNLSIPLGFIGFDHVSDCNDLSIKSKNNNLLRLVESGSLNFFQYNFKINYRQEYNYIFLTALKTPFSSLVWFSLCFVCFSRSWDTFFVNGIFSKFLDNGCKRLKVKLI